MGGTAKIEKCTGSDDAIWNRENSDIYADGGTVDGTVNNQGTIKRSEGAAAVTVFNGTVYNRSAGTIIAGMEYIMGQWRTMERSAAALFAVE